MRLPGRHRALLDELLDLAEHHFRQGEVFLRQPENARAWLERGHANGILLALEALGYGSYLTGKGLKRDPVEVIAKAAPPCRLAWQQGLETGEHETRRVLAPAPGHAAVRRHEE